MEDHRLRAFCLVVELKSFSKAAEAKFMTQSAMSHLIKNLEDELGVRLLLRQGRKVRPTQAGRLLYDHAKTILDLYATIESDLHALMKTVAGPLQIGASPTAAACILPQIFYGFSRTYPDVRIELAVSNTEKTIADLREGRIAVGVVEGPISESKLSVETIAEDEIVVIASDDNPLVRKKAIEPGDILSHPLILPEAGSGTRELINDFLRDIGIAPDRVTSPMTLGSQELIIQMVQAGTGISLVSKWSVFKAVQEGRLRILTVRGRRLRRKFYLATALDGPATASARAFREFVKGYRFFVPF